MKRTKEQIKNELLKRTNLLTRELNDLKDNWSTNPNNPKTFGDAGFLQVRAYNKDWRISKMICRDYNNGKKHYDGWIYFSASTNDNIYEMYSQVLKLIDKYGLNNYLATTERQL